MRFIAFGLMLVLSACGGDKDSATPVAPSPPPPPAAPTVTGLSIVGSQSFRTGQTENMRADVTLSNGATQAANSPTWNTSNSTVATISQNGLVSAAGHGSASITVNAQGLSAELPIRVWQDYQGTWSGTYIINVCTDSGGFKGFCQVFPRGTGLPFRLVLTQTNDSANGTLELGLFSGPIRGGIFDTRRFVGAANLSTVVEQVLLSANVGTFSVLSTGNSLAGTLVVTFTADGISGNGYWEASLGSVTKSLTPAFFGVQDFHSRLMSFVRR